MLKKVLNINFLIYFLNLHIVKILKRMNNGKKNIFIALQEKWSLKKITFSAKKKVLDKIITNMVEGTNKSLKGDLINVCKYLIGECKEDWTRLFSLMSSGRTRDNRHKLKYRKFILNMRKIISSFKSYPERLCSLHT